MILLSNFRERSTEARLGNSAQRRRFAKLALPVLVLATLAGCGDGRPARVEVSGKVLIDGEPVTGGIVQFVSEGVRPSAGKINQEGSFTLSCYDEGDGIIPGNYKVMVAAKEILSETKVRWLAPKKYADYRISGLSFDISESTDDLTIELTWGKRKPKRK